MKLNKLTSVAFEYLRGNINAESFRTFLLNNPSLEMFSMRSITFEEDPKGPPAILSNLRSLSVCHLSQKILSTLLRAPALQRLSSLSIFPSGGGRGPFTFCAAGEGIVLTIEQFFVRVEGTWKDLTGYANPTIRHVIFKNPHEYNLNNGRFGDRNAVLLLLTDAETLEVDRGYAPEFYPGFWKDLRELGPQLRTIRLEGLGEIKPLRAGWRVL